MHSNPIFRDTETAQCIATARAHGMGTLTVNGAKGPLVSHIPFLLKEDGSQVEAHLTRSNPILKAIAVPQPACLSVVLGTAYVSPDWYEIEDQVPTMNYIAVHLRAQLSKAPTETLRDHLDRMSAHFEGQFDKVPWTSDKMSDGLMERMMRAIVPVVLDVESVDGTWKLSQNKPEAARHAAAEQVLDPLLARKMRELG